MRYTPNKRGGGRTYTANSRPRKVLTAWEVAEAVKDQPYATVTYDGVITAGRNRAQVARHGDVFTGAQIARMLR